MATGEDPAGNGPPSSRRSWQREVPSKMHARGAPRRPPEASPAMTRALARALLPIESFLQVQAASGIVLLAAAALALFLANSKWQAAYHHFWEVPLGLAVAGFSFVQPLHFWVNDGLMTLFFFVVGLEIRHEIQGGELSTLRRALLPLAAAVGGMLVPAALYLAVARGTEVQRGWGVPMATDIAFAVGALTLLGARVPAPLRVLLLALAVIDDIGGILVIAVFYSGKIQVNGLLLGLAGVGVILLMQKLSIRRARAYVLPAVVIWAGFLQSGIHPTLAGVLVGLLTPARAWLGEAGFLETARHHLRLFEREMGRPDRTRADLVEHLDALSDARREALAPVERLTANLHKWVAFAVMPLFALANAGVTVGGATWGPGEVKIAAGIILGLVVGKPIGILAASWLVVRLRIADLPGGVTFRGVATVGVVGGIGFTIALFIAQLAFPSGPALAAAKTAILIATVGAGVLGLLFGLVALRPRAASPPLETATSRESTAG